MKKIAILFLLVMCSLVAILPLLNAQEDQEADDDEEELYSKPAGKILVFSGGGSVGMNYLLDGYDKYDNGYSGGVHASMGIGEFRKNPKYTFRLNYEYMPLVLPDGPYGMTESISAFTLDFLYSLDAQSNLSMFAGPGIGYYFNTVTMDTPASGYLEHVYRFMGVDVSLGMALNLGWKITLLPEIRFHLIREPGSFWAKNIVYQLGASYSFANTSWEKWRRQW